MKNKLYHILLLVSLNTFAQDDIKARIEFEEAEKAFMEEKYEEAISYLEKTETLLGKYSPKISYLKIESLDKITDIYNYEVANTQKLVSEVQKYLNHFKNNSKDVVVDKYKVVYKIDENLKFAKKNYDDTQTIEFKKAKEAYDNKEYKVALEWYTKAADKGNAVAMSQIGSLYYYGEGVDKNYSKAFEWQTKAFEKGSKDAIAKLSFLYDYGDGVTKNNSKAFDYAIKLLDKGSLEGFLILGRKYHYGDGTEKDYEKAFDFFNKAVLKNNINAMAFLGKCYLEGKGTTQNFSKAFYWLLKAAESGDIYSMNKVFRLYAHGQGVNKDCKIGIDWLMKSADKGSVESFYLLGNCFNEGFCVEKNYLKAAEWYEKALENKKNHINSLNELSILYETGGYGLKKDKSKAKELRLKYENAKNE